MSRDKKKPKSVIPVSEKKYPKTSERVPGKKIPVIAEEVSLYDERKAAWRVSKIQLIDPYGWHELDAAGVSRIKEKLATLERNTWKEIFVRDARFNH
jgi:hypothetical protein